MVGMQVIGFNFTKISAHKQPDFKSSNINTNIEFTDVVKEEVPLLKDDEAVKVGFQYSLTYGPQDGGDEKFGEMMFEGNIVLSVSADQAKDLHRAWEKKNWGNDTKIPLFNLILKKCSAKVLFLAEEIGLPSPIPLPKLSPKQTGQ